MGDVNEDDFKNIRTCLVIWHNYKLDDVDRAAVVDMDELQLTNFAHVKIVHRLAFLPPPNSVNMERAERKNLERRLGKPLVFGEMIEYDQRKNVNAAGYITSFKRSKSLFETRTKDGYGQVLLRGAVNPKDPRHFYTEFFTHIEIPKDMIGEATPNVFLEAWVSLDFDGKICQEKFYAFHGVCPTERQYEIGSAPWNVDNSKYKVFQMPDSDDEDDMFSSLVTTNLKTSDGPDLELYKREAYMTGDRSFMLAEFPQYKCFLPLRKHESLKLGAVYLVDCIWHQFANIYLISNIVKAKLGDPLRIDKESNMLLTTVKTHDRYLNVFCSEDAKYGFVDDPDRRLSLLHLTDFKTNSVAVHLVDGRPTRCGQMRFRIKEIASKNLNLAKMLSEKTLRSDGIVLDDGIVYCAEHGPVDIVINDIASAPPPGTRISFVASFDSVEERYGIQILRTSGSPITSAQLTTDNATHEKTTIFKTIVKTCVGEKPLDKLFESKDFGMLEDEAGLLILDKKMPHSKNYTVWVMKTIKKGSAIPRSYFEIVGVGEGPPQTYGNEPDLITEEDLHRQEVFKAMVAKTIKHEKESGKLETLRREDDKQSQVSGKYTSSDNFSAAMESLSTIDGYSMRKSESNHNQINRPAESLSTSTETIHPSEDDDSSNYGSLRTCDGGIDPRRHPSRRTDVPKFTGPVSVPPNQNNRRFDVVETLSRLKTSVFHGPHCGINCSRTCPYINHLAKLVMQTPGFWNEVREYYPQISHFVMSALSSVPTEHD